MPSRKKLKLPSNVQFDEIETRETPWGPQWRFLNPTGPNTPTWQPYNHANHIKVHGRWLLDHEAPGQCVNHGVMCSGEPSKITVPSATVTTAFTNKMNLMDIDATLDLCERPIKQELLKGDSHAPCGLLKLPPELMRQILDYIIPSGCVFHFLSTLQQVVQKLVPKTVPRPASVHTGLAATSKALHDTVCRMLYGENIFVFNIATRPIRARVYSNDFRAWESWSRLHSGHGAQGHESRSLGPITARTAPYLRKVGLIITHSMTAGTEDIQALGKLVTQAAHVLRHGNGSLERLVVDFRPAVSMDQRSGTLTVDRLQADPGKDGRMHIKLREVKDDGGSRQNKIQKVLEPLRALKGIKCVKMTGALDEEFAEELVEGMKAHVEEAR